MPNRLANESSPYLLQHKDNPVDWYPWSEEALSRARDLDRPIFLSIGYAACHWCHVMEHESFENEQIAGFLNENFVSIKVDREERPDIDQIYMQAVMALKGGGGGWPLSAFLLPNTEVFYGGTYWPPTSRMGMPGFDHVLTQVLDAYKNRRSDVEIQATQVTAHLNSNSAAEPGQSEPDILLATQKAFDYLVRSFDTKWGGFGSAPKFPRTMDLQLLLNLLKVPELARTESQDIDAMIRVSLDRMARGGIYDQVGGGFARYSVDAHWLVPHFEKMLYDNGLLIEVYTDAYLFDARQQYRDVVEHSIEYLCRDMQHELGGFYSSEDADSEGAEGTFYIWTEQQIKPLLGEEEFDFAKTAFGITPGGNFEGKTILNLPFSDEELARQFNIAYEEVRQKRFEIARKLHDQRNHRVRPGCDDKVIVSWNALAISGLAKASWTFELDSAIDAAIKCGNFILQELTDANGRLYRTWRNGKPSLNAYLDDYANFIVALCDLYEATFDETWIEHALQLAAQMLDHFSDEENGGFYFTGDDHEKLITRNKDYQDSSIPSGNSMAATGLIKLGRLTQDGTYLARASTTVKSAGRILEKAPMAAAQLLVAAAHLQNPSTELVFVGTNRADDIKSIFDLRRANPIANATWLYRDALESKVDELDGHFQQRNMLDGQLTLYYCENHTCKSPATGIDQISQLLNGQRIDRPLTNS